jgi:hypothetical protein
VPVDKGFRRKCGVAVAAGFSLSPGVCAVAALGLNEIAGVGVVAGDKFGVSVKVTLVSGCGVIDSTGFAVVALLVGVGVFLISCCGPSAGEGTSD